MEIGRRLECLEVEVLSLEATARRRVTGDHNKTEKGEYSKEAYFLQTSSDQEIPRVVKAEKCPSRLKAAKKGLDTNTTKKMLLDHRPVH